MTTITLNASGNWASTGTWSPAQVPVAGDDVILPSGALNLTIGATAAAATLTAQAGYTGTVTANSGLTLTGGLTMVSGMTQTGVGQLTLNGTQTINCAIPWNGAVVFQGSNTYTLSQDFTVNGAATFGNSTNNPVLNGYSVICKANVGTGTGSISGTTVIVLGGTTTWTSSAAGFSNSITINSPGTVTFSGTVNWGGGTMTYVAGTLALGTAAIKLLASSTFTGFTSWSAALPNLQFNAAMTVTLGSDLYIKGSTGLQFPNYNITWAGAYDIYCEKTNLVSLNANHTMTMVAGQKLTVTTDFNLFYATGPSANHPAFVSSTPGTKYKIVLGNGASQELFLVAFTDCDASQGQPLFTFGGSATTCYNVWTAFPVPMYQPTSQLGVY